MNHPALDAYLDELLDLTVDAVAPAPVAANAPVMALASGEAVADGNAAPSVIDAGLLAELDSDPLFAGQLRGAQVPGSGHDRAVDVTPPQPSPAGRGGSVEAAAHDDVSTTLIDAGLLAELDSDPLFATNAPASPATSRIDPGLLAELDSDPLFAAPEVAASQIDPGLLAELDSDPLFAAPDVAAPQIDPGLLAELDSDPLFAAAMAAPAAPSMSSAAASASASIPASAPIAAPAPATPPQPPAHRPTSAQPDARTGLRPVEFTPPALPPSVTTTHRWLRVAVGEDSYAIELLRVQEVGRTAPIVAMRGAAPSVLGAMNLRGRIVPVFDLGLWLGTGRVTPDERARIVVVERDNELIGALVSAVDDVVTLGPDRIEPPLMASPSRAIVGVARVVAKPTVLLDANALFG